MARSDQRTDAEDLLDVRRAAALAGRHPETVRRWVWSGRLAARRQGNRLLETEVAAEYTKPDVADYGDLEELTARAGAAFTDSPLGGPNGSRSTP